MLRRLWTEFAAHFTFHLYEPEGCVNCPWCGRPTSGCTTSTDDWRWQEECLRRGQEYPC